MMADTVLPVGYFDDAPVLRTSLAHFMFLINAVLDEDIISSSLERLINRPGWKKLGARLRRVKADKSKLEWHVPAEYTSARPAFRFHHVRHQMPRAKHPLGRQVPDHGQGLSVSAYPESFRELWHHPSTPRNIDYYFNRDEPLLGLHVTSFDDATVVTLDYPHIMLDAMAFGAVMKAWTSELQGNPDEILVPRALDPDPLTELGRHPSEPYAFQERIMPTFQTICFAVGCIYRKFVYGQQLRSLCVPSSYLQSLRDQDSRDGQFLSDGDMIPAWWHKVMTLHLSNSPDTSTMLYFPLTMRKALGADLFKGDNPYLGNATALIPCFVPAGEVNQSSVSGVASHVRTAIATMGTRQQIEAWTSAWRQLAPQNKFPLVGDPCGHCTNISNVCKANLFDVDFSGAITKSEDGKGVPSQSGKPVYVQPILRDVYTPDWMFVNGRDRDDNYWLTAYVDTQRWKQIQGAIDAAGKRS